jgi:enediyne biosynthesis protein E4
MSTGFSRHALPARTDSATSERKVFTLYWRPLRKSPAFLLATALALLSCEPSSSEPPLFVAVAPETSGIRFANSATGQDTVVNIVNYLYFYNGGGVAAGDIDGDGRVDLYFTSNLGANRLYRNLGGFRFEDITERAGVADSVGWKSGVTMADVNGDGHLDIYVSGVNHLGMPGAGRNVLYINNGDATFTDRAEEYGLGFSGYSTQAAFFDYDGDADLDMYLLNSSTHAERLASPSTSRLVRNAKAGDRLYRNDDGRFVDVSATAGIYGGVEGFGLGVVASDLNLDGCLDIYIANDFPENDFLYLNNCDGTFTESITQATGHTSRFSMGADAADFNNDGRPDIAVLDMLPDSEPILKTAATTESYELFNRKLAAGYHYQYARNTLQLNRGITGAKLRFSEIGYFAGIAATDWSWAPLFADFDNDGRKDLFVSAGIYRRPNDLDYLASVEPARLHPGQGPDISKMPHVPLPNYAFRNNGDLTFTNKARAWGLGHRGFSNGAAYADLDNDGALDLIVNNLNAAAAVYRNRARELDSASHRFLTVTLRGAAANTGGVGAKVIAISHDARQMVEVMPTRGFQSAVDPRAHFGLDSLARLDSLIVVWPDKRFQVLTNVPADQFFTVSQADAAGRWSYAPQRGQPLFADLSAQLGPPFKHHENTFFDYGREPLMPHLLSTEGPALAVGDVNGDGRDDIYVGGAKWQPGALFVQTAATAVGSLRAAAQPAFRADSLHEDVAAALFDADGDRDLDLYVVSGGNEFWEGEPLRDRLYLNDSRGNFQRARDALPDFLHNGSSVAPGDFDGDGDVDLFVGSRVVARRYGVTPRSYLLENDGQGHFRDVTAEKAPVLAVAGMVSRAVWVDYDGDLKLDLIVVGEWTPARVFHQENGRLVDRTEQAGLAGTNGWWTSVQAADLNADGRPDLVLGNLGLNSYIRASRDEPVRLYVGDFFDTGRLTQILTSYRHGVSYPLAGRDELLAVAPSLASRYPTYASFGASRIEDIVPSKKLKDARVLEAYTFASAVALNRGDGTFEMRALPHEAQLAPIYASLTADFDGDGHVDLVLGGNFSGVTPVQGRYDASYGLLLRGDGHGGFSPVDMEQSGLAIEGQVRFLAFWKRANGERIVVVGRNNDRLQMIKLTR